MGHPLNPETHTCIVCGYIWKHGADGSHSCADNLRPELTRLKAENERLREAVEFAHSEGFEWPVDPLTLPDKESGT